MTDAQGPRQAPAERIRVRSPLVLSAELGSGLQVALIAPGPAALDDARRELGLDATAPVPLVLEVEVAGDSRTLLGSKTVFVGVAHDNPDVATLSANAMPVGEEPLSLVAGEHAVEVEVGSPELRYQWLSDRCDLDDYRSPAARLHIEAGETCAFGVVVRDELGGVGWRFGALAAD